MLLKLTDENKKLEEPKMEEVCGKGANPIGDIGQILVCLSKQINPEGPECQGDSDLYQEIYDSERLNS